MIFGVHPQHAWLFSLQCALACTAAPCIRLLNVKHRRAPSAPVLACGTAALQHWRGGTAGADVAMFKKGVAGLLVLQAGGWRGMCHASRWAKNVRVGAEGLLCGMYRGVLRNGRMVWYCVADAGLRWRALAVGNSDDCSTVPVGWAASATCRASAAACCCQSLGWTLPYRTKQAVA